MSRFGNRNRALFATLALAGVSSCMAIRPRVVSRKTPVEEELVGEVRALEPGLATAQPVRAMGAPGSGLSPTVRDAVIATMNRQLRLGAVRDLKRRGLVGESRAGTLSLIEGVQADAEVTGRFHTKKLVEAENGDRETIIQRVLTLAGDTDEGDAVEIRLLMYEANVEASAPGTLIEDEQGAWIQKIDPRLLEEQP